MNKLSVTTRYAGKITTKDVNKMHRIIGDAILKELYDNAPTIIHFYPYFFIHSSNKSVLERRSFKSSKESQFQKFAKKHPEKAAKAIKRGEQKRKLTLALYKRHQRM